MEAKANSNEVARKNGVLFSSLLPPDLATKHEEGSILRDKPVSKKRSREANPAIKNDYTRFEKLIFLGTGAAVPVPRKRNMSSMVMSCSNGALIMVDCGEGSQHQLKICNQAKASKLDLICITHLHGDHSYGIFGLLLTCGSDGKTTPITVVGPVGLRQMVETVFKLSGGWTGNYQINFVEIPDEKHVAREDVDVTAYLPEHLKSFVSVTATPLIHSMTCWGYAFTESDRPGKLDMEKARSFGVPPGPLLGKLKGGQEVEVNGKIVRPCDVLCNPLPGRKVCMLQDSSDSSHTVNACRNADLYIHEATFEDGLRAEAIEKGHSTGVMAAEFANAADAKKLVLTHFSARYNEGNGMFINAQKSSSSSIGTAEQCCDPKDTIGEKAPGTATAPNAKPTQDECVPCGPLTDPADLIIAEEARKVFTRGAVVAAKDFLVLEGADFKPHKLLAATKSPWGK